MPDDPAADAFVDGDGEVEDLLFVVLVAGVKRDELATLGRLGILSYEEQVRAAETSLEASFVPKVSEVPQAVLEPATREEVEREEA